MKLGLGGGVALESNLEPYQRFSITTLSSFAIFIAGFEVSVLHKNLVL